MKVGLIDVDGHHFPNLALMKISSFHKKNGDSVSWATVENYDITYVSKVFTFSPDFVSGLGQYGEIIKGGTGFKMYNTLPPEIDKCVPDYSIYPSFKEAYGFLTRGCPNKCSWCVVPHKEGQIFAYADIEDFLEGRKIAILMDNNVLAHEHGLKQIEKIIRLGIKVDFNQGLDVRIIAKDKEIAKLLSKVNWLKWLRIACDTKSQMPYVEKAIQNLKLYNFEPSKIFSYVLVKDIPDALERVLFLKEKGCFPFAQPFRNFETNEEPPYELKRFARWVNRKQIFAKVDFKDYK